MALDRRKRWRTAERLLKQGDVQAALSELQKISESAPDDLQTLNRLGDLLARQGRDGDAIHYYAKIAVRFEQGGFIPKAIAMHKKIVRLEPGSLDSVVRLGELYLQRKLLGEAAHYLLHAANQHVQEERYDPARKIYEKLAEAQPEDLRHRVRLAEVHAAEGDSAAAVEILVTIGACLLESDEAPEAERIYSRAVELVPTAESAVCGLSRCLGRQGRTDEAIAMLGRAHAAHPGSAVFAGELVLCHEMAGQSERVAELLEGADALAIPADVWRQMFRSRMASGRADALWTQLDGALKAAGGSAPSILVLESLSGIEPDGYVPALERLCSSHEDHGNSDAALAALRRLAQAYRAGGDTDSAGRAEARAAKLRPEAPAPAPAAAPTETAAAEPAATPPPPTEEIPVEVEAPAVPLNRREEDFVSGGMTQAAVLQKYELVPQALEQLDEVTDRFPGHVDAQKSRVAILRESNDAERLSVALIELALAHRAVGEHDEARKAAAEASERGHLDPKTRKLLQSVALIDAAPEAAPPEAAPVQASRRPTRVPGEDMMEEIRQDLAAGRTDAALRQLQALQVLGYASPEMERLAQQAAQPPEADAAEAPPAPSPLEVASPAASAAPPADESRGRQDAVIDLEAISSALEDELLEESEPVLPEEDPSLSMEEILATFRERVKEEIGSEDYQTHYDLGVGYKEMGLTDEAIHEFEIARQSDALYFKACTMIALCHRDRQEFDEAARCYREALDGAGPVGRDTLNGLRYDLAEVLLQGGKAKDALAEFRSVLDADPEFRDVRGRVDGLQAQTQS